jgi:hypothetical protein
MHVVLCAVSDAGRGRYDQAQAKLDKLEGKAGSYEHISGVVKDQNESLAKELSSLHRQVSACGGMCSL